MAKNLQAKTVAKPYKANAYEVWQSLDGSWTWYVLKKWQADDDKPYARWFCLVTSPMVGESGELGDVYVSDIKANARRVDNVEPVEVDEPFDGIKRAAQVLAGEFDDDLDEWLI